jgi:hypothetical protein
MDKVRMLLTGAGLTLLAGVVFMVWGPASADGLSALVAALGLGGLVGAAVLAWVSGWTARLNAKLVLTGTLVALFGLGFLVFGGPALLGAALGTWLLGFGLGTVVADRF